MRSSPSRWLTWRAPRRATLPHPAALRGSGGRSSACLVGRSVPGLPRAPASREVPVLRGGPGPAAPDRAAPSAGRLTRGARPRAPSWGAGAGRSRPGPSRAAGRPWATRLTGALRRSPVPVPLLHFVRCSSAPAAAAGAGPARPGSVPAAPRVPPLLAGRRSPPPVAPRTDPGAPLPRPSCCGRTAARRPNPCPARRRRSAPDARTRPTAPMGRGDSAGRSSEASGDSRCPGRRHPGRRRAHLGPVPSRRGDRQARAGRRAGARRTPPARPPRGRSATSPPRLRARRPSRR